MSCGIARAIHDGAVDLQQVDGRRRAISPASRPRRRVHVSGVSRSSRPTRMFFGLIRPPPVRLGRRPIRPLRRCPRATGPQVWVLALVEHSFSGFVEELQRVGVVDGEDAGCVELGGDLGLPPMGLLRIEPFGIGHGNHCRLKRDEQPRHRFCVVLRGDRWQGSIAVLPGSDGFAPRSHAADRTLSPAPSPAVSAVYRALNGYPMRLRWFSRPYRAQAGRDRVG